MSRTLRFRDPHQASLMPLLHNRELPSAGNASRNIPENA